MNIVWLSWKDIKHPQAGGAENISWHLMKALTEKGHSVNLITSLYENSKITEKIESVEITRTGNKMTVYKNAYQVYKEKFSQNTDLVIDEMNTIPFASAFYSNKPTVLLTYQLARSVWFYQMVFPLSLFGYIIEPLYLFTLSRKYKTVVTESESTRQDMKRYGFNTKNIHLFRVGIELQPLQQLPKQINLNSVLILGALRPMKRTLSAIKGFENARDNNSALTLKIAGDTSGKYAENVLRYTKQSRHSSAITVLGKVSSEDRLKIMQQATVILVASVKEGWGLIVTEANSQGTPAIAYDSDGLRDSIQDDITGMLVKSGDESAMGKAINALTSNRDCYEELRFAAWNKSKQYTFENSYKDFIKAIGIIGLN